MGIGGIGIWQLLIILVIVLLLFGTKRLRNLGQDLGSAVRGFRSSMKEGEEDDNDLTAERLEKEKGEQSSDAEFDQTDKDREH